MKERFPRVQWFTCSPQGVLKVADPVMAVQYDTRFDSKAVAPRSQQYFYQYCPDDVNESTSWLLAVCPGGGIVSIGRSVGRSPEGGGPLLLSHRTGPSIARTRTPHPEQCW